ncbi:MAG: GDSL-type esterase/lipase family protein [Candidatus Thiodiazotropha sp.]
MNAFKTLFTTLLLVAPLAQAEETDRTPLAATDHANHLVIIGASYAGEWPIEQVGCLRVENRGIGGQVSTEVEERFAEDALSLKPKAVLIWGFINDFANNSRDMEDETRETAIRNIEAMAEAAHAAGVIPVLATEVTMGAPDSLIDGAVRWINELRGKRSYQRYISDNVMAVNRWIRDYAAQKGYPVLDIEGLMTNEAGNRKEGYFTEDLSHISAQAYRDLDAYAIAELKQTLIEAGKLCPE